MAEKKVKKGRLKTIDIVYIGLFAGLICICAWIAIPLTISITLQTMGVCLTAGLLGMKRGTLAVATYILLGAIGLPVFTGFKGGLGALTGATGGYITGFIFTALIIGAAADKLPCKLKYSIISMAAGIMVCYLFGTVWFMVAYKVSFVSALSSCVIPFILPDAIKLTIAAMLVSRLKKFVR